MNFNVYCDESYLDCITSKRCDVVKYMAIGSIWLKQEDVLRVKNDIKKIKERHNCFGELKWSKVSGKKLDFYKELIDLFWSYGSTVRFRCIIIDRDTILWKKHNNDAELGFYKFYYQMLRHWIYMTNSYKIYCDKKVNSRKDNLKTLKSFLDTFANIVGVYAAESRDMPILQFADFFTGLTAVKFNNTVLENSPKKILIEYLEEKMGRPICETFRDEPKFNIFNIKPNGGW